MEKITPEELREIFNKAIENASSPDQASNLELCREYFTNADFRSFVENFSFAKTFKKEV